MRRLVYKCKNYSFSHKQKILSFSMKINWGPTHTHTSSSSSCHAISTDVSEPLSPPFHIVHCFWQVFRATSSLCTELLYVCSSWTSGLCSSLWKDPQEYITYELVPTSPAGHTHTHTHTHIYIYGRCQWCNGYRRKKMDTTTRVQILDEIDCISHSTNTLGKGMNPIILPPAMGK